jgi:O-antigen/teichoic acid export membrane protein
MLVFPLLGFLLFLVLFYFFQDFLVLKFSEKSPLFSEYIYVVVPLTFIFLYTAVFETYLKVHLKVTLINFLKEVLIRVFLCLFVLAFVVFKISEGQGVLFFVLSYTILLLVMIAYLVRQSLLFLKPQMEHFPKSTRNEMMEYALYMVPGVLGSLVAHKIDTAMIAYFKGLPPLAVYSTAYFIAVSIEVPRRSIAQITVPILSKAFAENDRAKIQELYQKNSVNQFLSGALLFCLVWISADELYNLIPRNEIYRTGKYVILFVGLGKLIDMITSVNNEIIQMSKYFRFNILAMIFLGILTVISNYFLIPVYDITGAAIAYFITVLLFNLFKTFFVYKKMGYQPFQKELIPLLVFVALAIAFEYFFPGGKHGIVESLMLIAIKSLVVLSLFLFMVRKFYISPEFNDLLNLIAAKAGLTRFFNNGSKNK